MLENSLGRASDVPTIARKVNTNKDVRMLTRVGCLSGVRYGECQTVAGLWNEISRGFYRKRYPPVDYLRAASVI